MDVENFLHHGVSGGAPLRVGVVGHVPADQEGAGQHSPLGHMAAYRVDTTSERIWDVEIPSPGDRNGGGKPAEDRKLCHPSPKNFRVKYCGKENHGPMSGCVSASRNQFLKRYWEK